MPRIFPLLIALFLQASNGCAETVAEAIKAGGVALVMRHATAPGNYDPDNFRLDDCATQRNLSDQGREEARRIGKHLEALGLAAAEVLTSQWCRCRETARLAFGAARDWPALNSFIGARENETAQISAVMERIARLKPEDMPLVLVTHQVVVTAITGIFPQSGEVVVVAPSLKDGRNGVRIIGSIRPEQAK